jgi:hypothetical protein
LDLAQCLHSDGGVVVVCGVSGDEDFSSSVVAVVACEEDDSVSAFITSVAAVVMVAICVYVVGQDISQTIKLTVRPASVESRWLCLCVSRWIFHF